MSSASVDEDDTEDDTEADIEDGTGARDPTLAESISTQFHCEQSVSSR